MRKILSIILAISILCTMAITPVMAEDVALDEVTETETVTPEDNTSTEDTTPEDGEGSEEVTPPEEEVQETSFKVLYTLPSLLNGDPAKEAQNHIAVNQETIKVVFTENIADGEGEITFKDADGVEPAGGVYVTAEGNTATVKFGELKTNTEYTLTVPATLTSENGVNSTPATFVFKTIAKKNLANADFSTWADGTYTKAQMSKDGLSADFGSSATMTVADGVLTIAKSANTDAFIGSNFGTKKVEYETEVELEDGTKTTETATKSVAVTLSSAKVISFLKLNNPTNPNNAGQIRLGDLRKGSTFGAGALAKSHGMQTTVITNANATKFAAGADGFIEAMLVSTAEETAISEDLATTTLVKNIVAYDLNSSRTYTNAEETFTPNVGEPTEVASVVAVKNYGAESVSFKSVRQGFYVIPAPMTEKVWDGNTVSYVMNTDIDVEKSTVRIGDHATDLEFNPETRVLTLTATEELRPATEHIIDFSKVVSVDGVKGMGTDSITTDGEAVGTFDVSYTLPTNLHDNETIALNQEEIKIVFTEEVESGYENITFTDTKGNAPKGGLYFTKNGATVTVKFGELDASTTYTLRIPGTIVSTNGNYLNPVSKSFTTMSYKEFVNADFSDSTFTPGAITLSANTAYFKDLGLNSTFVKNLYYRTTARANIAFNLTEDGTLSLAVNTGADTKLGGLYTKTANSKVITVMSFPTPTIADATGMGLGATFMNSFSNCVDETSNGLAFSNISSFGKNSKGHYDVTMISSMKETGVAVTTADETTTTTVTYTGNITINDNTSTKTATSGNKTRTMTNLTDSLNFSNGVAAVKILRGGNTFEIATLRQGFFTFPAPLSEGVWNAETKTLTYVMNTDIDVDASTITLGDYATEVSYNEATRELSLTALSEDFRSGYDHVIDFKKVVSADGFKGQTSTTFNDGGAATGTFAYSYTLPSLLNGQGSTNLLAVNQGEIKVVFDEELASGWNNITFTDPAGNAPKGGIFVSMDDTKKIATVKFGELDVSTTYTLRIPGTIKSTSGNYLEAANVVFKTHSIKTFLDHDFSTWADQNIAIAKTSFTSGTFGITTGLYTLIKTLANGSINVTDGVLNLVKKNANGDFIIGAYTGSGNTTFSSVKMITDIQFKPTDISSVGNTLFGTIWKSNFGAGSLGSGGVSLDQMNKASFTPDADGFYDVTLTSELKETAMSADLTKTSATVTYKALDNISGKTANGTTITKTDVDAGSSVIATNSFSFLKHYGLGTVGFKKVRMGTYTIPEVLKAVQDKDAKTVTFTMNTDIASGFDKVTLGDLDVTNVSYNADERAIVVTYDGYLRNGFDYAVNITDLVSADGFNAAANYTFNNGLEPDETFEVSYTLPTNLFSNSYIAVNQGEIKVVFAEEVESGYEDITFVDANGNAPKGGIAVTKDGATVTVKFGELETSTKYTLRVPSTLKSVNDKYFNGLNKSFTTRAYKELINVDFSDSAFAPGVFTLSAKKGTLEALTGNSAFGRLYYNTATPANITMEITENGTFKASVANANTDTKIGALFDDTVNTKVVTVMSFPEPTIANHTGTGIGGSYGYDLQNSYDGVSNGIAFSDLSAFGKNAKGNYDVTLVSDRKEAGFDGTKVTVNGSVKAYDNCSSATKALTGTINLTANTTVANNYIDGVAATKVLASGNSVEIATLRQGFFTIPEVLKAVQDKEANTVTFTMNTDIASGYENITLGDLDVTNVSYNADERAIVVTYDGHLRDGYDYTVSLAGVVSADGFEAVDNYVYNNGEEAEGSFDVLYTLPSTINAGNVITPNQETIKVVFGKELASGLEKITFVDANGNAPIGGVDITADGSTATLKFGELELNTTYKLRVPSTVMAADGTYSNEKVVTFKTIASKELADVDFTGLTELPENIKTRINNSSNTITLAEDGLTLSNTTQKDTIAGAYFGSVLSTAKVVSKVKFAEPTINETNKGANLTFGGFWKSNLQSQYYTHKGISYDAMSKKGMLAGEDGLYDVTVVSSLDEASFNADLSTVTMSFKSVAYDNITGKTATWSGTSNPIEVGEGSNAVANSMSFVTVLNKDEAITVASAKVGFYTIPAALTSEYDAADLTYTYVMNTDMDEDTIAKITVNGEAATAEYDADTRTIVVQGVPNEDATVNFYGVYSADGFEVEIEDKTPVVEPVEFEIANNDVVVDGNNVIFSFDYTNDEVKTVQVIIAEYHGNKLAKVEVADVELGVEDEFTNYTSEIFTLANSEANELKIMATVWDMATLEALCGAVSK